MCAIKGGKVLDTSMGFTPLEGLIMGTRSGDIDPAVVSFLQEKEGLSASEVLDLLNRRSGLLGLSGKSSDMRDLLSAMDAGDERAKDAVEAYCYRIRKYIGAYFSVLNGLDLLIFTAGVGENSPQIRQAVCADMDNLGITIDDELNQSTVGLAQINQNGAPVMVLVVPTNEELMIAKETTRIISEVALSSTSAKSA
jgi:acetate kinase